MPRKKKTARTVTINEYQEAPPCKRWGGSNIEGANARLVDDVLQAFPLDEDGLDSALGQARTEQAVAALLAMEPQDALEGMIAAQTVMAYAASTEAYRRAALLGAPAAYRQMNLDQAAKATKSFTRLAETLQKVKGKAGRQTVNVHHHHHDNRTQVAAGTAHLHGSSSPQPAAPREGAGSHRKGSQPHAPCERGQTDDRTRRLSDGRGGDASAPDLSAPLRREDEGRDAVPVAGHEREEAMPDARRKKPRRAEGRSER